MSRIMYVAHPVAGDVDANIKRAIRWIQYLSATDTDTAYIAPWIVNILAGEDDEDPYARSRGIRHCCLLVRRCDGIVLVGGRISAGMEIEQKAAIAAKLTVIDLTGLGEEPPDL